MILQILDEDLDIAQNHQAHKKMNQKSQLVGPSPVLNHSHVGRAREKKKGQSPYSNQYDQLRRVQHDLKTSLNEAPSILNDPTFARDCAQIEPVISS